MDYGLELPEVNSARVYAGAGSGPLLATAASWEAMAAEMMAAASQLGSVLGMLSTNWMGPSSEAMVASLMPYLAWMLKTATSAEHAAIAHATAAAAHEAAFMGVIPPPVIAENRTELATLVATNFMGINSPAIAANEAEYSEFWAQDASTLYTYANSMAAMTSGLGADSPLPALPTSDPAALASAAQDAVGPAGNAGSTVSDTMGQMSSSGQGMSQAMSMAQPLMSAVPAALKSMGSGGGFNPSSLTSAFSSFNPSAFTQAFGGFGTGLGAGFSAVPTALSSLSSGSGMGPVTAAMGRATPMGQLSAPQGFATLRENWADAGPAARPTLRIATPAGAMLDGWTAKVAETDAPMGSGAPLLAGAGSGSRGERSRSPLPAVTINPYRVF